MSKRIKLTPGRVEAAVCTDGKQQTILRDSEQIGLGLRVTARGAKAYIFQGKLAGQVIRMTLDSVDSINLSEARNRAADLREMIRKGRDPRVVLAERTASDMAKRLEEKAEKVPAMEAWREYLKSRANAAKKPWSARTLRDHERLSDPGGKIKTRGRKKGEGNKTLPGALYDLLQMSLDAIDDRDTVVAWLEANQKRPAVASFAFVRLRAFMGWCAERPAYRNHVSLGIFNSKDVKDAVPASGVKTDGLERQHLQAWFEAVRRLENHTHAAYLQAVLLTGARRNEIASIKWDDISFRWNQMTIRDKVDDTRVIPLTPYVKVLLLDLMRRNEARSNVENINGTRKIFTPSPFVFASRTAASGYIQEPRDSHKKALTAAGLPHVTIHGLRRSFGSLSGWCDIPSGVIPQIQGHKPSATAEKHYRVRPIDLLYKWHSEYESWILEQADIEQPQVEKATLLKAVV